MTRILPHVGMRSSPALLEDLRELQRVLSALNGVLGNRHFRVETAELEIGFGNASRQAFDLPVLPFALLHASWYGRRHLRRLPP